MLANRRVKLNRLPCRELFRVDSAEACRVVEAAAGSLIVARRPLPPLRRQFFRRFRVWRWRRPLTAIVLLPVLVWLIGALLHP